MFCKGCGNQLNDGALFCPKCGHKTGNQMYGAGAAVQSNTYTVDSVGNANSEQTKKKKHTVPIVISIIAVVIAIGIGGTVWMNLQLPDDVDTSGKVSSEDGREEQDNKPSRTERSERTDNTASQASVKELLKYIDRAEKLLENTVNDVAALNDSDDPIGMFRDQAAVLETALSDLSELKKQADAVSGIDVNLENAKTEYFNIVNDSLKAYFEAWDFLSEFIYLAELLDERPLVEDYTSLEDSYNDLYTWYESTKEGYSAISFCPSSVKNKWEQLGDTLDLNESVVKKLLWAEQNEDALIYFSALNMINRYDTIINLQVGELLDGIVAEGDFFTKQMVRSVQLAEEIHTYADLSKEKRGEYEFEYARTGELSLSYDAVDTIYPSLYNTYDAFLNIKAGCLSGSRKIVVEAEIPGLTQKYKESFTLDSAYRTISIKPPALTGNLDLSSAKSAQISVTVSEQDGTLIEAKTFPVTVQSRNDVKWYTDDYGAATQDNILCFLTPESSAISQLKRQAVIEISRMTGGQMDSFAGYQGSAWNHYATTYMQVAGIMRALNEMGEMGVRYINDTFSISNGHQHVLLPSEVLERRQGLCIETSLVVASALQSAGMHAFLIFPPDHAMVAVEIWDDGTFENVAEGEGEYFLIETTALGSAWDADSIFVEGFEELQDYYRPSTFVIEYLDHDEWVNYLTQEVEYIIDCDDSRVLGLTPFVN